MMDAEISFDDEIAIVDTAALLLADYCQQSKMTKQERNKEWKNRIRERALALVLECEEAGFYPLPADLIMVCRRLLGRNAGKDWDVNQWLVLAELAQTHPPPQQGEKPKGRVVTEAGKILERWGGIRKKRISTASGKNDYEQTFLYWCEDKYFLREWRLKWTAYKKTLLSDELIENIYSSLNAEQSMPSAS